MPEASIFFIDDIDRLSDNEISLLFKLVKNIADFPKVIYVLAYDRDVVAKALERVQAGRGEVYLQKIVQVPFTLPQISEYTLKQYLIYRLNSIIKGSFIPVDSDRFHSLYSHSFQYYVHTMRDCIRVINSFEMKYLCIGMDCDMTDLFAMTILELYESKVYHFMQWNKLAFLNLKFSGMSTPADPQKEMEIGERVLPLILNEDKEAAQFLIGELFPSFAAAAKWSTKHMIPSNKAGSRRICFEEYFDRYFELTLHPTEITLEVTKDVLNQLCSSITLDQKIQILTSIWDAGQTAAFFFQSGEIMEKNWLVLEPPIAENITGLFEALTKIFSKLPNQERKFDHRRYFVESLFKYLSKLPVVNHGECQSLFNAIFQDSNISLSMLFYILYACSVGQGWVWNREGEQIIAASIFEGAEKIFYDRILNELQKEEVFFRENEIQSILNYWKKHDQSKDDNRYSQFMGKVEPIISLALRIQVNISTTWVSDGHHKWEMNKEIEQYQTQDHVHEMEQFLQHGGEGLTEMEKEKIAAFVLCCQANIFSIEKSKVKDYLLKLQQTSV